MTTISTNADLITAVTEYLARDNDTTLIARIPTFIQLAEAKFNRNLYVRQMEARSTATVDTSSTEPEFISLPSDFQSMRRIRLSSVTGKPQLTFKVGAALDEYRSGISNATGQPVYFSIMGTEMELCPTPASAYTLEMVYRATIPPLATNTSGNWLLTLAPDVYLYGALLESAPYIKDDNRIQVWGLGVTTALDGLIKMGMTSTFNAGPLVVLPSGQTP